MTVRQSALFLSAQDLTLAVFDEGSFRDNREEATRRVQELKDVMQTENQDATETAEDPLLEVFRTVWYRVAKVGDSLGQRQGKANT